MKKKEWRRRRVAAVLILLMMLVFGGCGQEQKEGTPGGRENLSGSNGEVENLPGSGGESEDLSGSAGNETFSSDGEEAQQEALRGPYALEEVNLPSPELSLSALRKDGMRTVSFPFYLTADGILYREAITMDNESNTKQGHYVQKLEPPYESWALMSVPYTYSEGGSEYHIGFPYFRQGVLKFRELSGKEDDVDYLAGCDEDGNTEKILGAFPEQLQGIDERVFVIGRAGNFYTFEDRGNKLYCLNQELEVEREVSTFNLLKMQGVLTDAAEEKVYWYGTDDNRMGIYDLEGNLIAEAEKSVCGWDPVLDMSGDGVVYMASNRQLWRLQGKEWELLCDFGLRDYPWSELYDIRVQDDGSVLVYGSLDGEDCLVRAAEETRERTEEKREIVLAFHESGTGAILKSVSRFNRQSDRYHITVTTPEANESWWDYGERLRLEIVAGRGPDILSSYLVQDLSGYIENGYFANLEGMIEDESQYLQAAFAGGRTDGVLYGIPYDFCLHLAAYSEDFTGGRTAWTLPELMEAVEASEAEILQYGCDGLDIVLKYGLYDNDNTAYIDWEKGESHLEAEPFLKLLEFARKYRDTESEKRSETEDEMLRSGKAAAAYMYFADSAVLKRAEKAFEGKTAVLGYPRTSGNGIYAEGRYLYVNSASGCREGVEEYLRFLLSEQEQSRYMINESAGFGQVFIVSYFPVNLNSFRKLEEYWQNTADISEKQIEQVDFMLENAKPDNWYARDIRYIFSEELEPYFAGDKTAEQAAEILDSRVQIYLDERK